MYRHNRGAVRALSRVHHQRDAISRPTRHRDCVDAGFANGLATRTSTITHHSVLAPLKLRQMLPKTLPDGR